jgi:hypothetical protein
LEEVYQDDTLWCISPRSSVTVFVIDTTTNALTEHMDIPALKVYPNPANDYLMLESEGATITGIDVYDTQGKVVLRSHSDALTRVNVTALKPGEYFLRVTLGDGGVGVVRFVKR